MQLIINKSCSIGCLKILAVSNFNSLKIEVVKESGIKEPSVHYFDLLDNTTRFFSSNAACRYLNNIICCIKLETDMWLEWESVILQPAICSFLKITKEELIPANFKNCLNYLNEVLKFQKFLSSTDSVDLVDIVIWSNLYPLYKASLLSNVAELNYLNMWLTTLGNIDSLLVSFALISQGNKSDNLKKILAYENISSTEEFKFFMPVNIPGYVELCEEKGNIKDISNKDDLTEECILFAYENWIKGKNDLHVKPKSVPVLPKKNEKNILITSALPYVNNVPHLGNIIGAVLSADVFARYCRLRGYNTLYICGTDEYGTATETKALTLGVTPKEICDKYNKLHSEIYQWFNISFDYFGRTTTEEQTKIAQHMFNKLYAEELVFRDSVEQLFCGFCKRFLADRFVEGICPLCGYEDARGDQCDKCGRLINATELKNPQCKVCKKTPRVQSSQHLFLDLPKLEAPLKEYLERSTSEGCWSNTAKVIAQSWLKEGLKPRCITRDLKWGTPVPLEGFTDKVFYVWFDAPIGYLSITANYTKEWEQWWKQPDLVQLYQFMAKDNVPFHSIVFPACQFGTKDNYTIVNHLAATEYLNYEDVKFSKSRGIGVFGDDAKNTGLPSDVWRFYLLYLRPEAQDTYFSWSDLMLKINSELLNNLGNFINRSLMFLYNYFEGKIPEMALNINDKKFIAQVDNELKCYINCMEKTKMRDAIKHMLNISRIGNQYIQSNKPWELIKEESSKKKLAGTVLGLSANVCCLLCTIMEPYLPDSSLTLKSQLNTEPIHHVLIDSFVCLLSEGHKLGKPTPLFKKIEQDQINELKKKYSGQQVSEKDHLRKTLLTEKDEKTVTNGIDPAEVQRLEALVTEQGHKVRELKSKKAEKTEIDQEVSVLLEMKRNLLLAKGEDPPQVKRKGKK